MSATIAFCFKSGMELIRMETILFGRDKGKIFVKSAHRKLGIIPRLVKDIQGKKRSCEIAQFMVRSERFPEF